MIRFEYSTTKIKIVAEFVSQKTSKSVKMFIESLGWRPISFYKWRFWTPGAAESGRRTKSQK